MKNKIITVILIVQILFSFFLANNFVSFSYEGTNSSTFNDMQTTENNVNDTLENGQVDVGDNGKKSTTATTSVVTSVANTLIKFLNIIPSLTRTFLTICFGDDNVDSVYGMEFTIQKVIFNDVKVLNIDFFNSKDTDKTIVKTIKNNVATFFVVLRNIALVINLLILIYSAIRMAISSVADEKAKYKKMCIDWLVSFVLIMTIQIIMAVAIEIMKILNNFLINIYNTLDGNTKIENNLINGVFEHTYGLGLLIPSVLYWILTFYQLKFAYLYFKRVIAVGFLIVISPLVISSYALDKAGDGEAQALRAWAQEFIVNLVIQPMHILLFSIFFIAADNIVSVAPIVSVILIVGMTKGEKALRKVFKLSDVKSMDSFEKSKISFSNMKSVFKPKKDK